MAFRDGCSLPKAPRNATLEYYQAMRDTCLKPAWAAATKSKGINYPGYTITVQAPGADSGNEKCGGVTDTKTGFYCDSDHRIFIFNDWKGDWQWFVDNDPAFAHARLLAHEDAHYEQLAVFGMGPIVAELESRDRKQGVHTTSRRLEMQAECIAQAQLIGAPGPSAIGPQGRSILSSSEGYRSDDSHGDGAKTAGWVNNGFKSGGELRQCNTWAAPRDWIE